MSDEAVNPLFTMSARDTIWRLVIFTGSILVHLAIFALVKIPQTSAPMATKNSLTVQLQSSINTIAPVPQSTAQTPTKKALNSTLPTKTATPKKIFKTNTLAKKIEPKTIATVAKTSLINKPAFAGKETEVPAARDQQAEPIDALDLKQIVREKNIISTAELASMADLEPTPTEPEQAAMPTAIASATAELPRANPVDQIVSEPSNEFQSTAQVEPDRVDRRDVQNFAAARFAGRPPVPIKPASAIRKRLRGELVLRGFVGASGQLEQPFVQRSSGHLELDQAALEQALAWSFQPALEDGVATGQWVEWTVAFR